MIPLRFPLFSIIISAIVFSGCKKVIDESPSKSAAKGMAVADGYVLTPEGPRPAATVHLIEKGYHLAVKNGHVFKVETASGKVIADFGLRDATPGAEINGTTKPSGTNVTEPAASVWMTYSQWLNTSGQAINSFSTSMTVPPLPTENDGQVIFIFEGLSNAIAGSDIMQPVLQYGNNGNFGGNYWSIANWYVWSAGGGYGPPTTQIQPNTVLQGVITYTGQTGSSYNYLTSFTGYPNSNMPIVEGDVYEGKPLPAIPEQYAAFETLEAYKSMNNPELQYQEDYPPIPYISMNDIQLLTGGNPASLTWASEVGSYTSFGENTVIISNNSAGAGDVELFFKYFAPYINGQAGGVVGMYEGSPTASGTITAYAGQTVNVEAYTFAKDQGLTQTVKFQFTTNGVDFITGGNQISATNSSTTAAFIMPSSGTVNWSATYSQIGGGSFRFDGANIHVY